MVKDVAGDSHEWFSFLLASKCDSTYTVRDLLIVDGTKAEMGHVAVEGEHVAKAAAEVRKMNEKNGTDLYVIGWLHSHGGGTPFHSTEDAGNFVKVLNSVSLNTEHPVYEELKLIESEVHRELAGGHVIISGQEADDARITFALPETPQLAALLTKYGMHKVPPPEAFVAEMLDIMPMRTEEAIMVGFGYSIVVNDKKDTPYAEIGTVRTKTITGKKDTTTRRTKLKLVPGDLKIDRDELKAMVKARIEFPKRWWKGYHGRTHDDEDFGDIMGWRDYGQYGRTSGKNTWSSFGRGSVVPYSKAPSFVLKKPCTQLDLDELVMVFAHHATMYIQLYAYETIKYTEYMGEVMRSIFRRDYGLTEAIGRAGPLKPDGPLAKVQEPLFGLHNIIKNIADEAPADPEDIERKFMRDFIADENKALETYVPLLIGRYIGQK